MKIVYDQISNFFRKLFLKTDFEFDCIYLMMMNLLKIKFNEYFPLNNIMLFHTSFIFSPYKTLS